MRLPKNHKAALEAERQKLEAQQARRKARMKEIKAEQLRQIAKMAKAFGATECEPVEIAGALIEAQRKLESPVERKRLAKIGEDYFRKRAEERGKVKGEPEQGKQADGEGGQDFPRHEAA